MISFHRHMGKSTTVSLKQHLRMDELKSLVVQIVCECFLPKDKVILDEVVVFNIFLDSSSSEIMSKL